jgi:uncharacterized protein (TIGR03083 family)
VDKEALWTAIRAERLSLADLVEGLDEQQLDRPSLCQGWRVRDVAAHVTLVTRARPIAAVTGVVRARGNFDRWTTTDAKARAEERTGEQLARDIRDTADSRYRIPVLPSYAPLNDILVHGQDVAIPLGVDRPMPLDAAEEAADGTWRLPPPFFARRRCRGLRLQATDTDWARGEGDLVEGPMRSILLVLTGRPAGLDGLSGPGLDRLRATF